MHIIAGVFVVGMILFVFVPYVFQNPPIPPVGHPARTGYNMFASIFSAIGTFFWLITGALQIGVSLWTFFYIAGANDVKNPHHTAASILVGGLAIPILLLNVFGVWSSLLWNTLYLVVGGLTYAFVIAPEIVKYEKVLEQRKVEQAKKTSQAELEEKEKRKAAALDAFPSEEEFVSAVLKGL